MESKEENLREACAIGDLIKVTKLLDSGTVNVNSQNKMNSWTALHWAAKRGHSKVVQYLLSKGAQTGLKNSTGQTPADVSCKTEITQLLGEPSAPPVESSLPITPNYLQYPPFPYGTDNGQPLTQATPSPSPASSIVTNPVITTHSPSAGTQETASGARAIKWPLLDRVDRCLRYRPSNLKSGVESKFTCKQAPPPHSPVESVAVPRSAVESVAVAPVEPSTVRNPFQQRESLRVLRLEKMMELHHKETMEVLRANAAEIKAASEAQAKNVKALIEAQLRVGQQFASVIGKFSEPPTRPPMSTVSVVAKPKPPKKDNVIILHMKPPLSEQGPSSQY